MEKIINIAKKAGIDEKYIELYGPYKAKINMDFLTEYADKEPGKLILVTAITPTKAGEGKTTSTIALLDGLKKEGYSAIACLREPSLGPVFGMKGGATGGGKAKIIPEEDINLHFTGDIHALTSAVNLIAAVVDNYLFQGNALNIDPEKIVWKRALDMNDRSLREITVAEGKGNGLPHQSGFQITVASELMALLCLATSPEDFLHKLAKIVVAYTKNDQPITVGDLKITHAVMKLLREAFKPNLVQTLEGNPVLIHGGPFANIAHGCNSIIALNAGVKLADYVLTEAGFGADLGAEKFFDICMREAKMKPAAAVVVATIKALKMHGGEDIDHLDVENIPALLKGTDNLKQHVENIKQFGVSPVIAINHFASDSPQEVAALRAWCEKENYPVAFLDSFARGSSGAKELVQVLMKTLTEEKSDFHVLYDEKLPIEEKINIIAKKIYRAGKVEILPEAKKQIAKYQAMGYGATPICMAKTQYSFSDDPTKINAPRGFTMTIREVNLSAGAGFLVALTGDVMVMPGLGAHPSAVKMEEEDY